MLFVKNVCVAKITAHNLHHRYLKGVIYTFMTKVGDVRVKQECLKAMQSDQNILTFTALYGTTSHTLFSQAEEH